MVVAGVFEVTVRVQLYHGHRAVALLEAVGYGQGDGVRSPRTAPAAVPRLPLFLRLPGTAGHAGGLRARGKDRLKIAAVSEGIGKTVMCSSRWQGTALVLR